MAIRRPIKPVIETGYITTDKIADAGITTDKIANDAVTEYKMDPDSVAAITSLHWIDTVKTTNFTAELNKKYFCDTAGGTFTVTLPADPNIGDEVWFHDITGSWYSNNMIISGNGNTVMQNSTFAADIQNDTVIVVFAGADWRVVI